MRVQCNMGAADRIVRMIIGISLVLFGAAGVFPGGWRLLLPAIGLVVALTAAVAYCPLYRLLRLDGSRS